MVCSSEPFSLPKIGGSYVEILMADGFYKLGTLLKMDFRRIWLKQKMWPYHTMLSI